MNKDKFVLVTGCAGFIGFHFAKRLLQEGYSVVGLDNLNNYYEPSLKKDRLRLLQPYQKFQFMPGSLESLETLESLFKRYPFEQVVHLAAQAGVRYSLENPHQYIQANVVGFTNLLECCKNYGIRHLIYASSSSVYGNNKKIPFSVDDRVDDPVSLYAATKKANELLAHTYSHLYSLPTTGLRFFTVYGPWGRPDMALYSFTKAILNKQPIKLFNYGNMKRDFTYIDDCIEAMYRIFTNGAVKTSPPYKIYNIGNHHPVRLTEFIQLLEEEIGEKAEKQLLPMQPGDVPETYADLKELEKDISYRPSTPVKEGIKQFVAWYKQYYQL